MKAIDEYIEIVKEIQDIFLDTDAAFTLATLGVKRIQEEKALETNSSVKEMDEVLFKHTKPGFVPISEKTLGELKKNYDKGGRYRISAANMYMITVYSYWEDHYREAIAKELGFNDKYKLKSQIMGDIGKLRRSIIHHRAIALKDVEKCEILDWFGENDLIEFDREKVIYITENICEDLENLKKNNQN